MEKTRIILNDSYEDAINKFKKDFNDHYDKSKIDTIEGAEIGLCIAFILYIVAIIAVTIMRSSNYTYDAYKMAGTITAAIGITSACIAIILSIWLNKSMKKDRNQGLAILNSISKEDWLKNSDDFKKLIKLISEVPNISQLNKNVNDFLVLEGIGTKRINLLNYIIDNDNHIKFTLEDSTTHIVNDYEMEIDEIVRTTEDATTLEYSNSKLKVTWNYKNEAQESEKKVR